MQNRSRLAPFEKYMLLDDKPGYPMSIGLCFILRGQVDCQRFEQACRETIAYHPLLAALVSGSRLGWLRWEIPDESAAKESLDFRWIRQSETVHDTDEPIVQVRRFGIDTTEQNAPGDVTQQSDDSYVWGQPLDLRSAAGLRIVARELDDGLDVSVRVHHACCDGLGLMFLVDDMLRAYDALVTGRSVEEALSHRRPDHLERRTHFGMSYGQAARTLLGQLHDAQGAYRFLVNAPSPILPTKAQELHGLTDPDVLSLELSQQQTTAYRETSKRLGVTMNDLLARDYYTAIAAWQAQQSPEMNPRRWIRVSVPISVRTPHHDCVPAANIVSMVFLHFRPKQLQDRDRLLAKIRRHMDHVKRYRLANALLLSLRMTDLMPGGLYLSLLQDRCDSTCHLSNMGRHFSGSPLLSQEDGTVRAGGCTVERIDLVPPLRKLTEMSNVFGTYRNQLSFSIHVDPNRISPEASASFVQAFGHAIQCSLNE